MTTMIRFHCACGQSIKVADEHAGRRGRCPKCGGPIVVPGAVEAAAAPGPSPSTAAAPAAAAPEAPAAARRGRAPWLLAGSAAAAALVAAGGVGLYVATRPSAPHAAPGAAGEPRQTLDAEGRGRAAGVAPGMQPPPPPTLPDGRFKPGAVRLAVNVVSSLRPPNNAAGVRGGPDGKRFAMIVPSGNGAAFVLAEGVPAVAADELGLDPAATREEARRWLERRQGPALPSFEQLGDEQVTFSPDGRRLAYVGFRNRKGTVVLDDVATEGYDASWLPTFSPDSQRFAHVARAADGGTVVVLDGRASRPFDELLAPPAHAPWTFGAEDQARFNGLAFSPDSRRLAYVARRAAEAYLVIDGQEQKLPVQVGRGRLDVYRLIWSPDSRRLAVHVSVRDPDNRLTHVVICDAKPGKAYAHVAPRSVRFTPDSRRLLYVAGDDRTLGERGDQFLVDEGAEGQRYNYISPGSIAVSSDSRRLGFLAFTGPRNGGGNVMGQSMYGASFEIGSPLAVLDGKAHPGAMGDLVFSPDSRHVARVVGVPWKGPGHPRQVMVEVNGRPDEPRQPMVRLLQFSPDGKHHAYLGSDYSPGDPATVVVDGIAWPLELRGVVRSLRFTAPDRLEAVLVGSRIVRVVELKVVADDGPTATEVVEAAPVAVPATNPATAPAAVEGVPPAPSTRPAVATPAPATPVLPTPAPPRRSVPALADVRATAERLARVAEAAGGDATLKAELRARVPALYARYGAKDDALRAMPAEARRSPKALLAVLLDVAHGQLATGDLAGAARTAEEAFAVTRSIENVREPENAHHLVNVGRLLRAVGHADAARQALAMAGVRDEGDDVGAGAWPGGVSASQPASGPAGAGAATRPATWARGPSSRPGIDDGTEASRRPNRPIDRFRTLVLLARDLSAEALAAEARVGPGGGAATRPATRPTTRPAGAADSATARALAAALDVVVADPRAFAGDIHAVAEAIRQLAAAGATARAADYAQAIFGAQAPAPHPDPAHLPSHAREIGAAIAAAGDLPSAARAFEALGDHTAAGEALLRAGDKAGALRVLARAAGGLPPLPNWGSGEAYEYGRLMHGGLGQRMTTLRRVAALQAKAGDPAAAAQTFAAVAALAESLKTHLYRADALRDLAASQAEAGLAAAAADTFDKAADAASRMPSDHSQRYEALARVAAARGEAGDAAGALKLIERLAAEKHRANQVKLGPLWASVGAGHFRKGDRAAAEAAFARAIEMTPPPANQYQGDALVEVAWVRARAGDLRGALATLDARPGLVGPSNLIADVAKGLFDAGDVNAATTAADRLIASDRGTRDRLRAEMADRVLERTGDYKAALRVAGEMFKGMNYYGPTLERPLVAAAEAGDWELVMAHVDHDRPGLVAALAGARMRLGDRDGARRIFTRAVEQGLAAPEVPALPTYRHMRMLPLAQAALKVGVPDVTLAVLDALATPPKDVRANAFVYVSNHDPQIDAELAGLRTRAGDFDGALRFASSLTNAACRQAALNAVAGAVTERLSAPG